MIVLPPTIVVILPESDPRGFDNGGLEGINFLGSKKTVGIHYDLSVSPSRYLRSLANGQPRTVTGRATHDGYWKGHKNESSLCFSPLDCQS